MSETAILTLGADTRGLLAGIDALEQVPVAGAKAEKATDKAGDAFKRTGNDAAGAAPKVKAFNGAADGARAVAIGAAKALGGMAAAFVSLQAISGAMQAARQFNAALAETSTLIQGTPQQLDAITASARAMSKEFGGSATAQVQAYYQALSAGAASVEEATTTLDAANRLAVGGATDVTTAVGIMSGVINSYGKDAITAAQVSDALFVGMKTGVTTVSELSASLGSVIPTAKSLGISFDEVVAATAALTKNNLTTSAATTSLNAALVGIIKPTKEASDLAKVLGIEFSATGLQAQGLGGFLADVVKKTGGNVDAMSKLFGSVEALKAALLFAGEAGGQYAEIMEQMGMKSGATAEAFNKMADSLDFRWNRAVAAGGDILLVFGNALLTVAVPAMEALAQIAGLVATSLDYLVPVMIGLAATTVPALYASLVTVTAGMTSASVAAGVLAGAMRVLGAAVAIAGGPLGILVGLIAGAASYFLIFRDNAGEAETASYDAAKGTDALNAALGVFHSTSAPTAGAAAINLANDNYKLAESAYAAAEAEIAKMAASEQAIRSMVDGSGGSFTMEAEALISAKQARLTANRMQAEKALADALNGRNRAVKEVMQSDGAMAKTQEKLNSTIEVTVDSLGNLGGGIGGGSAGKAADALEKTTDAAKDLKDEMDRPLVSAIDGVANAFGDFVAGGLKDFGGFVKSIIGSFKQMLSQMIAMAVKNKIMIGLGFSGGGVGQAVAGVAGQAGGAGGLLGGAGVLGSFGKTGSILGLGGLGGGTGLMGGLGNALSGGLGNIFSIGANAAAAGGGIMATLGAVAPVLGIAAAAFSFFKSKTKELDTGLKVTVSGLDTLVQSFRTVEKSRFWGLSKKVSTTLSDVSEEASSPIIETIDAMRSSITSMAMVLGEAPDALDKFTGALDLSLKGLSDADAQQKVAEALARMGDEMVSTIYGQTIQVTEMVRAASAGITTRNSDGDVSISGASAAVYETRTINIVSDAFLALQKSGETATATLTRLSSSLTAANGVMDLLGGTLYQASLSGGDLASTMIDAFGGVDAMNSAVSTYWGAFYSEEERLASSTARLTAAMASLGFALPDSRDAFRALVEGVDTSTRAGATLYGQLIGLSGAFAEVSAATEAAADAIADTIKSILGDLNLMPTSRAQLAARNALQISETKALQAAASGDTQAVQKYLTDARAAATSDLAYREIAARVLAQLGGVQGGQSPALAQIQSGGQSGTQADNTGMATELRSMKAELAAMREENRQLGLRADRHIKTTADTLEKWDRIGLPMERTA